MECHCTLSRKAEGDVVMTPMGQDAGTVHSLTADRSREQHSLSAQGLVVSLIIESDLYHNSDAGEHLVSWALTQRHENLASWRNLEWVLPARSCLTAGSWEHSHPACPSGGERLSPGAELVVATKKQIVDAPQLDGPREDAFEWKEPVSKDCGQVWVLRGWNIPHALKVLVPKATQVVNYRATRVSTHACARAHTHDCMYNGWDDGILLCGVSWSQLSGPDAKLIM